MTLLQESSDELLSLYREKRVTVALERETGTSETMFVILFQNIAGL